MITEYEQMRSLLANSEINWKIEPINHNLYKLLPCIKYLTFTTVEVECFIAQLNLINTKIDAAHIQINAPYYVFAHVFFL